MSEKFDVIIIGAGIMGACTAFELAKLGYKTLNVDMVADAGMGSTSKSCAIVRAHYSTEAGVAMAYEGFKYWMDYDNYLEHVQDEKGQAKFMNTGSILLKSQGHDWKKVQKHYDAVGVEYKEMTIPEVEQIEPHYDYHEFWPVRRPSDPKFYDAPTKMLDGALFCPGGGYVNDPELSTHNVMRAAEKHGSKFVFKAKVVAVRHDDNGVQGVTLEDGTQFDAPVVLNAAGPHSFKINALVPKAEAGANIKTKALRHEVHHIPAPEGFDYLGKGYHTSDADIGCYFRPEVGNMILVGSEDPVCDTREFVDPDNYNNQVTDDWYQAQVQRLAKRVKNLRIPNQPVGICDLYDVSDDWIPIYDKSDVKGYYMCIGTSGNQYKNAPVVGYCMAALIDYCEKGNDHDQNPLQVPYIYLKGRSCDMGFFSRKRQINNDSSFSVNG